MTCGKRRFSDLTERVICREYLYGVSTKILSHRYNCDKSVLYYILDKYNIKREKPKQKKKYSKTNIRQCIVKKMVIDYNNKKSLRQIAKKHHKCLWAVYHAIGPYVKFRSKFKRVSRLDNSKRKEIKHLYEVHKIKSLWLSEIFKVSHVTILRIIRKNGGVVRSFRKKFEKDKGN